MNDRHWSKRLAPVCTGFLLGTVLLVASAPPQAAPGVITTAAGGGIGDGKPATSAILDAPGGIAVDAAGALFIADTGNGRIRKVSAGGIIETVLVTGSLARYHDFINLRISPMTCPGDLVFDAGGNLLFADPCAQVVRKLDGAGILTTIAGNGTLIPFPVPQPDGPATEAQLNYPHHIALDSSGNLLIAEYSGRRIRKVTTGTIVTVAGNSTFGSGVIPEGAVATTVGLSPNYVLGDGAGGFFFDSLNSDNRVRRVDTAGIITTKAGNGFLLASGDGGPAVNAGMDAGGLARDGAGNLYIAGNNRIRKVETGGTINTIAGTGTAGFSGDGSSALAAQFTGPGALHLHASGLYLADANRIRKIDGGAIATVAGSALETFLGDGEPATAARLDRPRATAVDRIGALYIAEAGGHRIRRVDPAGIITTIAGNGTAGSGGDGGPAVNAQLSGPSGVAVDAAGNVYVADTGNNRVRRIDASGQITTIAGTGSPGSFGGQGDGGPGTAATLNQPSAVAVDAVGRVYIADQGNNRVRRLDGAGTITTFAGGCCSYPVATPQPAATVSVAPLGLAFDPQGNLLIAQSTFWGAYFLLVDPAGMLRTLALNSSVSIQEVRSVAGDGFGNLYFADAFQNRVYSVDSSGTLTTLAGSGGNRSFGGGFSGEGVPGPQATLDGPSGVTFDSGSGTLFIADENNGRIRKMTVAEPMPDAFTFAPLAGAPLSSTVQSPAFTPAGFTVPAAISITGGEYSIGCTGTFVSTPGTIAPGQSVCVRRTTGSTPNADATTTLTIGGRSGTWMTTTVTGPGSIDVSPAALAFGGQSMNTTSAPQAVTLTNTGIVGVSVNTVKTSSQFSATHNCAALAPQATCTVNVTFTPGAAADIAGVLTLQNSPGNTVVTLAGTGERSLATHYYRSILRREPDPAGKDFWNGEASRVSGLGANINETWYAMAGAFYFSPEYIAFNRTDQEFLTDLYKTFFDRAPDGPGLSYWIAQLAGGVPREAALASFAFSPEFGNFTRAIFGNTAARAEVDLVMDFYRGLMARLPDSAGFDYWVQRMRAAQCSGGTTAVNQEVESISRAFIQSPEYVARTRTNVQYVSDLYDAFMRRGGELAGVNFWVGKLDSGAYTREVTRGGFTVSTEFRIRVARVLGQGCLP